ncbi:MAG: leucine-rich repeat domain-containing protein [Mariniphaga sp.]
MPKYRLFSFFSFFFVTMIGFQFDIAAILQNQLEYSNALTTLGLSLQDLENKTKKEASSIISQQYTVLAAELNTNPRTKKALGEINAAYKILKGSTKAFDDFFETILLEQTQSNASTVAHNTTNNALATASHFNEEQEIQRRRRRKEEAERTKDLLNRRDTDPLDLSNLTAEQLEFLLASQDAPRLRSAYTGIDFSNSNVRPEIVKHLLEQYGTTIQNLNFTNCKYNMTNDLVWGTFASSVKAINSFCPNLKNLNLNNNLLSDGWPKIFYRSTNEFRNSLEGPSEPSLPNLQSLSFSNKSIEMTTLDSLIKAFPNLQSLDLHGCKPQIASTRFIDSNFKKLKDLKKLQFLNLSRCPNTKDSLLDCLASNLPNLESLNLSYNNQITDAGLKALRKLTKLTSLNLMGCDKLTERKIIKFKSLRPNCTVFSDYQI